MILLFKILFILTLFVLIFQDFKQRAISWILIPLLPIFYILAEQIKFLETPYITQTAINLAFISLQIAVLFIFYFIKEKKLVNIIDKHIGIGDVLFFISLTFVFSPINFIIFYVLSLILSMIIFISANSLKIIKNRTIPLAGLFSILLFFTYIFSILFNYNILNDSIIINKLNTIYG